MADVYVFKIRVGVAVLQQQGPETRLLLVRQNNRPFWVLPGGTLEVGETLETCAVREIQEETGLNITLNRLLYVSDFIQPPVAPGYGLKQTLDVVFLANTLNDSPENTLQMTTQENLNEAGFITLSECRNRLIQPEKMAVRLLEDWGRGFQTTGPVNPYLP